MHWGLYSLAARHEWVMHDERTPIEQYRGYAELPAKANEEALEEALQDVADNGDLPAAIVTDAGGTVSHPAVMAREFGIPAVIGCSVATKRIKSGDRLRVDGSKGLVEVL